MPITKNDLINETAILCGITRDNVRIAIEQFFNAVKDSIKNGNSLEIRGFGTFSPKTCNPRVGRNLQTGELIPLATGKSMNFKFSSELKAKITSSVPKQVAASKQVRVHSLAKTDSL
ncbi:MAG: integration host factor subunit beta [Fibromonadaceae bacterium]|nr:integration host factor subunit beta [Fibromonadaceae bacterium]